MAIKNVKFYIFFLKCLGTLILISVLFSVLAYYFSIDMGGGALYKKKSMIGLFFLIVILIPPIETYFLQVLPYKLLRWIKVRRLYLRLIIPSGLFAILHTYSPLYAVVTFFGALIINYLYLYCIAHRRKAFLTTTLLHSLYNFFIFLMVLLLKDF